MILVMAVYGLIGARAKKFDGTGCVQHVSATVTERLAIIREFVTSTLRVIHITYNAPARLAGSLSTQTRIDHPGATKQLDELASCFPLPLLRSTPPRRTRTVGAAEGTGEVGRVDEAPPGSDR